MKKKFLGLIEDVAKREGQRRFKAFELFLELSFRALRGKTLIGSAFEENEKAYLREVGRLRCPEESTRDIAIALACATLEISNKGVDFLGPLFMEIAGSPELGQFFTPWDVTRLMSKLVARDWKKALGDKPYLTVHEPACGVGGMALGMAMDIRDAGLDVARQIHFVLVDIDINCVRAAYIQSCLAGMSASVVHGNSITLEEWSVSHTPMAIIYPKPALDRIPPIKKNVIGMSASTHAQNFSITRNDAESQPQSMMEI